MKITAIGDRRKMHTHAILDCKLKELMHPLFVKDTGDVTFFWYKWKLRMHGDYQFKVELSREEIVWLFVLSMSDVPLEKVVRLLGATLPNFHQLHDTTDLMIEMLCLMQALRSPTQLEADHGPSRDRSRRRSS